MRSLDAAGRWLERHLGGKARLKVIALLAGVLALDTADMSAVGAMSAILQQHFDITKAETGLLVTVSSGVAAAATLLFGWLADRATRTRVLAIAVLLWGGLSVLCGLATGYVFLLVSRIALGFVASATLPLVASLVGDYFPPRERATIYGYIISGEMIGTGFGFMICGELASIWWRLGFWALALPSPFLAWALHRIPEPARGGADQLQRGQQQLHQPERAHREAPAAQQQPERPMHERVRARGVKPREKLVYDQDPREKSIWWAWGYVLRIPSNVVLIVSSALAYYCFATVRVFGVQYLKVSLGLGHAVAIWVAIGLGIGAILGVWAGGRGSDALVEHGHLRGRVYVGAGGLFATAFFLLGGLLIGSSWISVPFYFAASAALGTVSPPIDAARLDIMHPSLWGRAESVRAVLRKAAEAIAPFVFGWLAESAFGGGVAGLHDAFLVMLVPLGLGGCVGLISFRTYLTDVATAEAFQERTSGKRDKGAPHEREEATEESPETERRPSPPEQPSL